MDLDLRDVKQNILTAKRPSTSQSPPKEPAKPRDNKTRGWSTEDDNKLAGLVKQGLNSIGNDQSKIKWRVIAHNMPGGRTGKQCRERYVNHLKAGRRKGGWTKEEDKHIMQLQAKLGNQWSKIASTLHGRTDNDVKNRWNSKMRPYKSMCKRKQPAGLSSRAPKAPRTVAQSIRLKIGQTVQKITNEQVFDGTLTKILWSSPNHHNHRVRIVYKDGTSEDVSLPGKDYCVLPTPSKLSEYEIDLCGKLLSLHNNLPQEPKSGQGSSELDDVVEDVEKTPEEYGTCHSNNPPSQSRLQVKRKAKLPEHTDKRTVSGKLAVIPEKALNSIRSEGMKAMEFSHEEEDGRLTTQTQSRQSDMKAQGTEVEKIIQILQEDKDSRLTSQTKSSHPKMITQGSSQMPGYHSAPYQPFGIPDHPQYQQLIAAAQLLSSANPGMAAAAVAQAQAQAFNNMSSNLNMNFNNMFPPVHMGHVYSDFRFPNNFQPSSRTTSLCSDTVPKPSSQAPHSKGSATLSKETGFKNRAVQK